MCADDLTCGQAGAEERPLPHTVSADAGQPACSDAKQVDDESSSYYTAAQVGDVRCSSYEAEQVDAGSSSSYPVVRNDAGDSPFPTMAQVGAALAAATLVSPAALGGIPVLPVTIDDERRRRQDEIVQESSSDVGAHQDVAAAATALTLSQRRLAAITREVEGTHAHDIDETDVVHAAELVAAGAVSRHQQQRFRAALGRVAVDSVDLFILLHDEQAEESIDESSDDYEDDDEAWLAEW